MWPRTSTRRWHVCVRWRSSCDKTTDRMAVNQISPTHVSHPHMGCQERTRQRPRPSATHRCHLWHHRRPPRTTLTCCTAPTEGATVVFLPVHDDNTAATTFSTALRTFYQTYYPERVHKVDEISRAVPWQSHHELTLLIRRASDGTVPPSYALDTLEAMLVPPPPPTSSTLTPQERGRLRTRLTAFYAQHAPNKVDLVDAIIDSCAGREHELERLMEMQQQPIAGVAGSSSSSRGATPMSIGGFGAAKTPSPSPGVRSWAH
eukprot:PhM_4_TR12783/c0_g1_i1/m.100795